MKPGNSNEERLKRIESQLFQIKIILLIMLFLLLLGVFGPAEVVLTSGAFIFIFGTLAMLAYCLLWLLEKVLNKKLGNHEEEMERQILQSIEDGEAE